MKKLSKLNEMVIQQLTGYNLAYHGGPVEELVSSMGLDAEEWEAVKPECEWLSPKLIAEIDAYLKEAV